MTVDDLIRELSALDPIDVIDVFPGRAVVLTERTARLFKAAPRSTL